MWLSYYVFPSPLSTADHFCLLHNVIVRRACRCSAWFSPLLFSSLKEPSLLWFVRSKHLVSSRWWCLGRLEDLRCVLLEEVVHGSSVKVHSSVHTYCLCPTHPVWGWQMLSVSLLLLTHASSFMMDSYPFGITSENKLNSFINKLCLVMELIEAMES